MRILLLNQFFWPDSAATSQLLTDVARELAIRGNEVHVICSEPGYALKDTSGQPDVKIHRVSALPFLRGNVGRLASYASFYLSSAWKTLRVPRPDVVVTLTTPPLLSFLGTMAKLMRNSRHFIWEMDMYPDVAVDLGYFKAKGLLDRTIGLFADYSRRKADGILSLGSCMSDRLIGRGVTPQKIFIAENWADSTQIQPVAGPGDDAPLTVLYSGNFGLAHDVNTIQTAVTNLKKDSRFRFVFAGGGARRRSFEAHCAENHLNNVEFREYSSKASLGENLGSGHIGLITQKASCLGSVVPSKVYGLLAAGRPILYIGPHQSTIANIIRQFRCGWQVECGDSVTLLSLLQRLQQCREEVCESGHRARLALVQHYDRSSGVNRVCEIIGAHSTFTQLSGEATRSGSAIAKEKQFANSF